MFHLGHRERLSPCMHAWVLSHFSCVWLFGTLWTVACQTPLSMGFSRKEYWSRLPCPSPGDLPNLGIEPALSALAAGFFTTSTTWEAPFSPIGPQLLLIFESLNNSNGKTYEKMISYTWKAFCSADLICLKHSSFWVRRGRDPIDLSTWD